MKHNYVQANGASEVDPCLQLSVSEGEAEIRENKETEKQRQDESETTDRRAEAKERA